MTPPQQFCKLPFAIRLTNAIFPSMTDSSIDRIETIH